MKILIRGGGGMGAHSTNYFNFTLIFLIFISIFYTPPKKKMWVGGGGQLHANSIFYIKI